MKRICVAGQKAMNARREAQLDAGTSSKPSNKAGALFGRNPQGRRGFRRTPLSLARLLGSDPTARLASRPASETDAVALFVSLC
jgi:hypothetical protein